MVKLALSVVVGAIIRTKSMVRLVEAKDVESKPAVHQDQDWVTMPNVEGSDSVRLAEISRNLHTRVNPMVNPMVIATVLPRVNHMVITAVHSPVHSRVGAPVADGVAPVPDGMTAIPRPGNGRAAVGADPGNTRLTNALGTNNLRARPMVHLHSLRQCTVLAFAKQRFPQRYTVYPNILKSRLNDQSHFAIISVVVAGQLQSWCRLHHHHHYRHHLNIVFTASHCCDYHRTHTHPS